jgi:oligo-1,6-glucosidase/alpha-glucosidase
LASNYLSISGQIIKPEKFREQLMTEDKQWWQKTTIYQIYPRSFKDSNGDGIGDIRGIISKLDYIQKIGFETMWISPFFSSPQLDWGYDVSDYLNIAPEYGSHSDVEELIQEVHLRGMRVLFDLVLNHTSDQHPWFQESRSSITNPKRDWYIWRDGRGTRPPNNWTSITGGSGWNYDPNTNQWYYASFLPFQPDLNYHNPEVVNAIFEVARFWLDKGVDGFRLDIFHCLYKDKYFRNNPRSFQLIPKDFTAGFFQRWQYNLNQPETAQFAQYLRKLIDSYSPKRVLLGEVFADERTIKEYLGRDNDRLNLNFQWGLMDVQPNAGFLKSIIEQYESQYPEPFSPVYVYGNHDSMRLMAKLSGDDQTAALLALFQFTARGVPVTYYGEEIGMSEVNLPAANAKDPIGRRYKIIPEFILRWLGIYTNRDGCRSPMQWENTDNAGFCPAGTAPWLPVNQNFPNINVASEYEDGSSLLHIYQDLLRIRKDAKAIHSGTLELLDGDHILAYKRIFDQETVLVLINFGSSEQIFEDNGKWTRVVYQIGDYRRSSSGELIINPSSGLILSE